MASISFLLSTTAQNCGLPDELQNGQRIVSGTTVTYSCNPGYNRDGPKTRQCLTNEQWSGSAPVCNRKLSTE